MLDFPIPKGTRLRVRKWDDMVAEFGKDSDGDVADNYKVGSKWFRFKYRELLCEHEFTTQEIIYEHGRMSLMGYEISTYHLEYCKSQLDWPNEDSHSQYTWQRPLWKAQPRFIRTPRVIIIAELARRKTISIGSGCVRWMWKHALQPGWRLFNSKVLRRRNS
jgi:hypothetical protein